MMAVWSPWEGVVDPKARARWERNGCAPTNAALEKLTGEERENIRSLGDAASLLSDNLRTLREDLVEAVFSRFCVGK